MRSLSHIFAARGETDERHFRHAAELAPPELRYEFDMEAFRQLGRQQALLMKLDSQAALEAIPRLLRNTPAEQIRKAATDIRDVVAAGGALSQEEQTRLEQVLDLYGQAARRARPLANALKPRAEEADMPTPEKPPGATTTGEKLASPKSASVRSSGTAGGSEPTARNSRKATITSSEVAHPREKRRR